MMSSNKNIVLIGMPGCGKTTVGKLLAESLSLPLIDLDEFIVERTGKTIPELFKISEAFFRSAESEAVKAAATSSPSIISTGGGIVKNQDNINELKKTGTIFFIDRPVEKIYQDVDTSTRPLLKDGPEALYKLYDERYELYKNACDYRITNDTSIEQVISEITTIYTKEA